MENNKCLLCGNSVFAPYRRKVGGKTVEGCVSNAHNGHVFDAWHNRKEAKQIRKRLAVYGN